MLLQLLTAGVMTQRLAKALAGDWQTVEVVQYGKPVPEGQGRRGTNHVYVANGGPVLVSEGHTMGTVGGELRWYSAFWWDPAANVYQYLTCFKAADGNGCELRGTAHWEGDTFVNDYVETVDGKPTKMKDVWSDITPNSHTLTEFHEGQAFVVSHDRRMP